MCEDGSFSGEDSEVETFIGRISPRAWMIACAELEDLAADYLRESLPRPKRGELERHVSGCRGCREFLAAYHRTVWVARQTLEAPHDPGQAPERLVQAILGSIRR